MGNRCTDASFDKPHVDSGFSSVAPHMQSLIHFAQGGGMLHVSGESLRYFAFTLDSSTSGLTLHIKSTARPYPLTPSPIHISFVACACLKAVMCNKLTRPSRAFAPMRSQVSKHIWNSSGLPSTGCTAADTFIRSETSDVSRPLGLEYSIS
jgi:hypothetical protein